METREMSDMLFYTGIVFFGVVFYLPSLWATCKWSGEHLTPLKFWSVVLYNCIFAFVHMYCMRFGELVLIGVVDSLVIRWFSFLMLLLFMFTGPVSKSVNCRFSKRKF